MLQAISLPADLDGTYAKVTFLCGNDDGPSCQMIRLLPSDGLESAAPLSLAMARTCLDSSTATATYPPSGATGTAGSPWNGIQPPPPYSSTDAETEGSGIPSTSPGSDLESVQPTSTTANASLDPSGTYVIPTTLVESTGGATGIVPSDVPSDAPSGVPSDAPSGVPSDMPSAIPSDTSHGLPGATTLITSTVAGTTNAPRYTLSAN
ncbi:hypothetical protein LY78DRAFT_670278 [Colletotrichum sublineola]|nr:hypothetical protein LY78DRAFT_670278 [Colletotrichum sublineola]